MPALYLTHSEVVIDPAVPMTEWRLSDEGRSRIERFAQRDLLPHGIRIVSSTETKTLETAAAVAAVTGNAVEPDHALRENERSSTGFMSPPERFDANLSALYAAPGESASGWETAAATQARIVEAVATYLEGGDIVFVGHGTIGTLLKCHLGRRPIARSEDQRIMAAPGGGNLFVFTRRGLLTDWMPIEDFAGF